MLEQSYAAALDAGLDPISYRSDLLQSLGEGEFPGRLDGLVWSKRQPCLMALVNLDRGARVQVLGFKRHSRKGLPEYLGLRALIPGQRILLVIDRGLRGGLRPLVIPEERVGNENDKDLSLGSCSPDTASCPLMQIFNAHEILSKFTPSELEGIADQLNSTGLVTDEDGLGLGSTMIEHWTHDCTALLRKRGYSGGKLIVSGRFFKSVGAIYVIYDEASRTEEDAAEHLKHVANTRSRV